MTSALHATDRISAIARRIAECATCRCGALFVVRPWLPETRQLPLHGGFHIP